MKKLILLFITTSFVLSQNLIWSVDEKYQISFLLKSIGEIYYQLGDYNKSIEFIEKSLNIYNEIKGINHNPLGILIELYKSYKEVGRTFNNQDIIELTLKKEFIPFNLNYSLYQLLEDTSYLETAYNQVQELANNLEPDVKAKFLSYPIPAAIVEEWEKVK